MDIKTAFLHSELEEKIYMKKLESYIHIGKENKVCPLNKFLYGLPGSSINGLTLS